MDKGNHYYPSDPVPLPALEERECGRYAVGGEDQRHCGGMVLMMYALGLWDVTGLVSTQISLSCGSLKQQSRKFRI